MSEVARAPVAERDTGPVKGGNTGKRLMLQRKCACGAGAGAGGECDSCAAKALLQRHSHSSAPAEHEAWPSSVNDRLSRTGRPLDADTRSFMEDRFGNDFSDVRVHDDTAAAASARDVDAEAYTVGQHIVFGDGHYQPQSESGRHLLAHELAHTVQQQGLQRSGTAARPLESGRYWQLEHEADRAADRAMSGAPLAAGALSRDGAGVQRNSPATRVATTTETKRFRKGTPSKTVSLMVESADNLMTVEPGSGSRAVYRFDVLRVPPEKGVLAKAVYADVTKLKVTFKGPPTQPVPEGNIERDDTDKLRRRWLAERQRKLASADTEWKAAGGAASFPEVKTESAPCEVDHIRELQVGGDNDGKNLQLLTKGNNGASGSLLAQQLLSMAKAALQDAEDRAGTAAAPDTVELKFSRIELAGAPKQDACFAVSQVFDQSTPLAKTAVATVDFVLTLGSRSVTLKLPADNSKEVDLESSGSPENSQFAWSAKGIVFERVGRSKGKVADKLMFRLDTVALNLSSKAHGGSQKNQSIAIDTKGNADLAKAGKLGVPFDFSELSPGQFTSMDVGAQGLTALGTIKPSLPFLPVLDVAVDAGSFKVSKSLDPKKMRSPIPGLRFTKAELSMELAPQFKPQGSLEFEIGQAAKPVAKGVLRAAADGSGLTLDGDLFVMLPGVDAAKGEIRYRAGEWSALAHIESGQMAGKVPFVKSGAVDVAIKTGRLTATGTVGLELPGGNEATMSLGYSGERWLFSGNGRFKTRSPYLKPIEAFFLYDGRLLKAKGKAPFAFSGLEGTVDATYEHMDGRDKVYGKGDIKIDKGRAQGSISVELHPYGKLTGTGKLSYKIKEGMVATAGITIDDKQKITFDGEMSFPDIRLFPRFPTDERPKEIFRASGSIPIPGASIGPIGLQVELYGSLGYYYFVGPGLLTGIKAGVKFSPFEPDPDFAFTLRANASIPAGGGITGKVGANVVLDAYIARVGGGLSVEAHAGLKGQVDLGGDINYSKDRFTINAKAKIGGAVEIGAALKANVFAEAGVWKFKVRTDKEWTLKEKTFDTGLSFAASMPLYYDSVSGFRMPQVSDIKPEPPQIKLDAESLLSKVFRAADSKEKDS